MVDEALTLPVLVPEVNGIKTQNISEDSVTLSKEEVERLRNVSEHDISASILLEQVETGVLAEFDRSEVTLLKQVLRDDNKKTIWSLLTTPVRWTGETVAPDIGGAAAAYGAAKLGKSYVTEAVATKMKSFIPETVQQLLEHPAHLAKKSLETVADLDAGASWQEKIFDTLVYSADKVRHTTDVAYNTAVGLGNKGIEGTVGIINSVKDELINKTSDAVGTASMLPAGALGWLGGSSLLGGTIGFLREVGDMGGFKQLAELIDKSKYRIMARKKIEEGDEDKLTAAEKEVLVSTNDPRIDLMVMFRKISDSKDQLGHKLTNDEWLSFISNVRMAKMDLVKERMSHSMENMITTQDSLAQIDTEAAIAILNQLGNTEGLRKKVARAEKEFADYNSFGHKVWRYSKAFVSGAFNATKIPLLWKITKFTASTTASLAKKVITMNPLA